MFSFSPFLKSLYICTIGVQLKTSGAKFIIVIWLRNQIQCTDVTMVTDKLWIPLGKNTKAFRLFWLQSIHCLLLLIYLEIVFSWDCFDTLNWFSFCAAFYFTETKMNAICRKWTCYYSKGFVNYVYTVWEW